MTRRSKLTRQARRRQTRRSRQFEPLENRNLMAANVFNFGGMLFINGTQGNDAAEVRLEGDKVKVRVASAGEQVVSREYSTLQVNRIAFVGNDGDDFFANYTPITSVGLGGAGDDVLFGGVGRDSFDGQDGNDRIDGGLGDDVLKGGNGQDEVGGDGGNDVLYGGADNDALTGGFGNDQLYGDDGADRLLGDAGNDLIVGGMGNDVIHGAAGRDLLTGGEGNDVLLGGSDNDVLGGDGGEDVLSGAAGNDVLRGGNGRDLVQGGDGDDQVYGDADNDLVFGGSGNDRVWGGAGNDVAYGDAGNDIIYGETGDDQAFGGDGIDILYGGLGDDRLDGGTGIDFLLGDDGNDDLYDLLALTQSGTRYYSSTTPNVETTEFGSQAIRNLPAAAMVEQLLAVREQQFALVAQQNQQLLDTFTDEPRILPIVGNADQNLTSIADSSAPAHLQTAELGSAASAVAYARQVRSGVLQDILKRYENQDPLGTIQWNVASFNQASPYLFFQKNEGINQFNLNIGMLQNQIGQNIFQYGLGALQSTGLVDQNLLNSIMSGNGGFDYQPPANDPFFNSPAFQSAYVGMNGAPSLGNFVSNIIGNDLRLVL